MGFQALAAGIRPKTREGRAQGDFKNGLVQRELICNVQVLLGPFLGRCINGMDPFPNPRVDHVPLRDAAAGLVPRAQGTQVHPSIRLAWNGYPNALLGLPWKEGFHTGASFARTQVGAGDGHGGLGTRDRGVRTAGIGEGGIEVEALLGGS
jgi:hypothetical protein